MDGREGVGKEKGEREGKGEGGSWSGRWRKGMEKGGRARLRYLSMALSS